MQLGRQYDMSDLAYSNNVPLQFDGIQLQPERQYQHRQYSQLHDLPELPDDQICFQ